MVPLSISSHLISSHLLFILSNNWYTNLPHTFATMRPSTLLLAASGSAVLAAPTPSLLGDILSLTNNVITTVTSSITNNLAQQVAALGCTLQTNANQHGQVLSSVALAIQEVETAARRFTQLCNWSKPGKQYINWSTYKANGVNLGAWLEIEQNYVSFGG
jgi:glucan 1,3-beta-glucosidase